MSLLPHVSHGGGDSPRVAVYQAWWAMVGAGTRDGVEWTREEKCRRIAEAGYEGILLFEWPAGDEAKRWRDLLDQHSLELGVGSYAADVDALKRDMEVAVELDARFVNAQSYDYFLRGEPALDLIRAMLEESKQAGMPCLLETHRACITQDLLRTIEYVRELPELALALDLSHYVVAGQMPVGPGELWPISTDIEQAFSLLLERTACFHGRVSNGHQVQIDVGPGAEHPAAAHFRRWWTEGMRRWHERALPGAVLPFVCELGPPPSYSITVTENGRQIELSDRWEQASVLAELAREAWADAGAEAS